MFKLWNAALLLLLIAGCSGPSEKTVAAFDEQLSTVVVVEDSARGWQVEADDVGNTTLVNPRGQRFDVGPTQYPDINRTRLIKIAVQELRAEFLILYVPPVASGGSTLTVFTIASNDTPVRAADLRHHWEPQMVTDWRETLFVDSDGDGIPELRDWGAFRWEGANTFYSFDGVRFHPLWVEQFKASEDNSYDMKLVSRRRVKTEDSNLPSQ